jgi:hypothetical protein
MHKFLFWQSIIGLILSSIVIIIGAWFFINSSDKTTGNMFFKLGLMLWASSLAWFAVTLLRTRNKKKASI